MNKITFFIFLCFSLAAHAQEERPALEKHLVKANLLFFPSVTYEYALADNWALKGEIGTTLTLFRSFGSTYIGVFPKLEAQLKYFYNLEKRFSKGKNIANNSGNFLSLVYNYQDQKSLFNDANRAFDFQMLGAVWGLQRTYGKRFSILFEIGGGYDFGYHYYNNSGRPFPLIGFELGWILFKH